MSSTIRTIASRTIAIGTAAVLGLASVAMATTTTDQLEELNLRAWNGETELLAEVYAPDAVHSATFYALTREYVGPDAIAAVARYGGIEQVAPHIDIPAAEGELRWADFVSLAGGSACLWRAIDDLIVRQDCVLPESSDGNRAPAGLADAEASASIDEVMERLRVAWHPGTTVEELSEVYATDAVHSARYLDRTRVYDGPEGIRGIIRSGSPETLGRVDFEAPEGELAWASVSDIAGGTVCLFRAVDGMITRHDCVLPIKG